MLCISELLTPLDIRGCLVPALGFRKAREWHLNSGHKLDLPCQALPGNSEQLENWDYIHIYIYIYFYIYIYILKKATKNPRTQGTLCHLMWQQMSPMCGGGVVWSLMFRMV